MFRPYDNIHLDLETLGLRKNAVILSIGACSFDLNDPPGAVGPMRFHTAIKIDDQVRLRREIDGSVFLWWLEQSAEAREAMTAQMKDADPLVTALHRFSTFMAMHRPGVKLWCKGADNDIAWLASAYDDCGIARPWQYNAVRDMRSFNELMIPSDWETTKQTQAHDALADAIAQTTTLQRFHQRMGWTDA